MMIDDPVIDGVRRARCAISREFDNDPARLVAHYAELQARYKGILVAGPEAPEPGRPSRVSGQYVGQTRGFRCRSSCASGNGA